MLLMGFRLPRRLLGGGWRGEAIVTPTRITPSRLRPQSPPVYKLLLNKYYVDEGYDYVFTGRRKVGKARLGVLGLGEASSWFDVHVIDGSVNAAGWITRLAGRISSWWDKWIIDGIGVNGPAILARMLSYPVKLLQWGLVQWYALFMVVGLVYFLCWQLGYARGFWAATAALVLLALGYLLAQYLRRRFAAKVL